DIDETGWAVIKFSSVSSKYANASIDVIILKEFDEHQAAYLLNLIVLLMIHCNAPNRPTEVILKNVGYAMGILNLFDTSPTSSIEFTSPKGKSTDFNDVSH
ncbi:MAG: hypothetical protein OHK93_005400, partial [Ramalina farinacea]|nr:hypothetical protein [Ramalina farinacea]